MELTDYLRIARHRWRSMVAVVLVSIAAAGLVALLTPRTYIATTSIVVSVVGVANSALELNAGSTYAQSHVKSLALVASEPVVLQPVIDSLGLRTTAADLAKDVTVTVPIGTTVISVAVADGDRAQAVGIANEIGRQIVAEARRLSPASVAGGPTVVATITRPAVAPSSPASPKPVQDLSLGLLVGVLLAAGQAVVRDVLEKSAVVAGPQGPLTQV